MAKQSLSTLNHCAYSLQYRLVLVTKYRRKVISPAMMKRLREIFEDTLGKWKFGRHIGSLFSGIALTVF